MNIKRNVAVGLVVLATGVAASFHLLRNYEPARTPSNAAGAPTGDPAASTPERRGEYLARAGNCIGCHTVRGGDPYAGGVEMRTPFGVLYAPNITPDPETGIGTWTADDFWQALHEGRSRDGSLLYPAFPYTNYTKVTRADSDSMFAYFQSVKPVRQRNREHDMRFPYNQRALLAGWRALYFTPGEYRDDPQQSREWNRGAYLVEGLGHCNACHSSRNILGAIAQDGHGGGLIPLQNWYAPSLTSSRETGVGDWAIGDIVDLLGTGVSARGAVFGPMAAVVYYSLQELTSSDLAAMAVYLKSQSEKREALPAKAGDPADRTDAWRQGAALYEKHCADCHQPAGAGVPRIYPPLADNDAITTRNPVNAIRMVLNGGFPPSTRGNPRPYGMPPFAQQLDDDEIAAVVSYIRQAWGNQAPAVSAAEVRSARGVPVE